MKDWICFTKWRKNVVCTNWIYNKKAGLYEIEFIDNANVTTISINPKEYFETFRNRKINKKHKRLGKTQKELILKYVQVKFCLLETNITNRMTYPKMKTK